MHACSLSKSFDFTIPQKHFNRKGARRVIKGNDTSGPFFYWQLKKLFLELVFFPPNVANLAGPPTGEPVTDIRYGMVGSTAHAFRFWSNFEVFDNSFRHRWRLLN